MWVITNDNELYHHGVKGMKWGQRKARTVAVKILEGKRRKDKRSYEREQWNDAVKDPSSKGRERRRERSRQHKSKDAKTAYRIAKQKAKLDPKYKDSAEYKKARRDYGQAKVSDILDSLTHPQKRH